MAFYQQPCDSYFVEFHDDREKRFREDLRKRERLAKHQTQIAIEEELSQLVSYEYRDDVVQQMEHMEVSRCEGMERQSLC